MSHLSPEASLSYEEGWELVEFEAKGEAVEAEGSKEGRQGPNRITRVDPDHKPT